VATAALMASTLIVGKAIGWLIAHGPFGRFIVILQSDDIIQSEF
jgi:hypothetical protein